MSHKINYEVSRSENYKKEAILFSKVPSYGEKYSFHISLRKKGRNLRNNEDGNIFIGTYDNQGDNQEILASFQFNWISSDTLEIFYSNDLEVEKKVDELKRVVLIYKQEHLLIKPKTN